MNIRCSFCQTPYTLSRVALLDALQEVDSKNLTHYDAHCPRCRRVTQIPRQKLELAFPNWKEALTEAVSDASAVPAAPPEPGPKASLSIEKPGAGKAEATAPAPKAHRKRTSKK